jgi:hypothetical protein
MATTVYRPSTSSTGDAAITGDVTVTGAATVTSDVTIDTNTLYVDASNNRVGIVNLLPASALDVVGDAAISSKVGVGNTAFESWDSSYNVVQIGNNASLMANTAAGADRAAYLMQNAYWSGSAFVYQDTDETTLYRQFQGTHLFQVAASGTAGNSITFTSALTINNDGTPEVNGDTLRVSTQATPASAAATGTKGDIVHDTGFIYVCTATDTWKRVAIASW